MITVDTTSSTYTYSNATSISWSHTVNAGNNRLLVVIVPIPYNSYNNTVSSISFGSQSLTRAKNILNTGYCADEIWYLIAPNVGTNTITVTYSNTVYYRGGGAISLFGVDQTSPLGSTNGATGYGGTASINLTVQNNSIIIEGFSSISSYWSPTSGQTQIPNTGSYGYVGYKIITTGGSYTETWTLNGSSQWALAGAEFKAALPPSSSFFLFFNN